MPDGEKRKQRNDAVKGKDKLAKGERRYEHRETRTPETRSKEAQSRQDRMLRATGRKKLASNYGKFEGET